MQQREEEPQARMQNVSARASTVEHAMRAPPFGTRKNALRRWRVWSFFLCQRSCKHGADIRKTPTLLRSEAFLLVGAGGRTRTDTDFTPQDFESSASASFTTPARSKPVRNLNCRRKTAPPRATTLPSSEPSRARCLCQCPTSARLANARSRLALTP